MTIEELRDIYKLKQIVRYNTRKHLKDESVAEHSFYVAMISLMLCDECNIDEMTTKDAIIKALLHDMPEIELNDITHDTKERLHLRPLLKKYEDEYYQAYFPKYTQLMSNNKGVASAIVEIADAMSVLQYVDNEQQLGNCDKDMYDIKLSSIERINNNIKLLNIKLKRRARYEREKHKD